MWSDTVKRGIRRETHFGREVLVFSERPKHVYEMLQNTAERYPDNEALVMGQRRLTYREMRQLAENIAGHLYHHYHVRKGDRVALLLGNGIEFALLFFACARIGAIVVPLNTRLNPKELTFMLQQSSSSLLFTDDEFAYLVQQADASVPTLKAKFIAGGERDGFLPYQYLESPSEAPPDVSVDEDDPLYIMYTSGTTGLPKGAVGSHIGVIHSVICYNRIFETTSSDRSLNAVPLFHVTGLIGQLLHMVYVGGTNVLMRRFKAEQFIRLLAEENITFTFNVPTIYVMMMSHPTFRDYRYPSLRILAYGGAPMSTQTIEQLQKEFPGVRLHNAYGATETSSPTTVMPVGYQLKKARSVGCPIPVVEVKIVNEQGQLCKPGEVGELWIKGPNVVPEYWDNPEANQKSFVGEYWCSGDLAMMDEDGFVYIMDRIKDMINRGGEKVFSVEVENVLYQHPKVLEAAVVGIPDPVFGEVVKAVIVPKEGTTVTVEEIKQFVKEHLADYKVPAVVEFWSELPRNPGGKVLKNLLREKSHT